MADPRRPVSSRSILAIVVMVLMLTMAAAVYLLWVRVQHQVPLTVLVDSPEADVARDHTRNVSVMLTILLISALLILLFVIGAYLLIRVGRIVARTRTRVGGKPTEYVDAWRSYRLTDEQIAAATRENGPEPPADERPHDEGHPD